MEGRSQIDIFNFFTHVEEETAIAETVFGNPTIQVSPWRQALFNTRKRLPRLHN